MLKKLLNRFWKPLAIYSVSRGIIVLIVVLVNLYGIGTARLDRWDSRSYTSIAVNGYEFHGEYREEGSFIAFFPLYPLTMRAVHWITRIPMPIAGYAVSMLAGAIAVCLLYEYVRKKRDSETALLAVALLSFFPSSVFMSSIYTESMFLALSLGVLVALQRNSIRTATILTGFALITRMTGLVLVPILAWHLWRHYRSIVPVFLSLAIAAIPTLIFMGFQWNFFGTPLAFLKAQQTNWNHEILWPWNGVWTITQRAWQDTSTLHGMRVTDFAMLAIVGGSLAASWRRVPGTLFAFGLGAFMLATSQSNALGTPRFMLMVLPFVVYWAHIIRKQPIAQYAFISISAAWMVFNTILFSLSKSFY